MEESIVFIRSRHPSAFRSGQWARITRVVWSAMTSRPCFEVVFVDGATDLWVIADPDGQYQFSDQVTA